MSRCLEPHEVASLRRGLARRTGNRVRVKSRRITVNEGIALWNASAAFECSRERRHASNNLQRPTGALVSQIGRILGTGASLAAVASLAGCATMFGGNVKGSFACRAPDGMCAPTSNIDDAALALISGETGAAPLPAGPYLSPPAYLPRSVTASSGDPVRSGEKVLRIVFPAHIDGSGRYREASAVHAVVERGEWMTAGKERAAPSQSSLFAPGSVRGPTTDPEYAPSQAYAEPPPMMLTLGELASSAPEMHFPGAVADLDAMSASDASVAAAAVTALPVVKRSFLGLRKRAKTTAAGAQTLAPAPRAAPVAVAASAPANVSAVQPKLQANAPEATARPVAANPIAAIRSEVSRRLGSGAQIGLRSTSAAQSSAAALTASAQHYSLPPSNAAALTGAGPGPAQVSVKSGAASAAPANGPSLFPASEVQP
jgi:conjugal transfer pilus assembly protein TraV